MKTRAAVLWDVGREWEIEEVEIDPPGPGEVLVKTRAAGMCHSDEHLATGDMSIANEMADTMGIDRMFPIIGGHEGAGEVIEVGAGVTSVQPGDHVSMSFIPACGRCHFCAIGRQTLCDVGAKVFERGQISDGRVAHHVRGQELGVLAKVGAFAEHMLVSEVSVVKIEPDLPFVPAALVSCGVATGWGSAVHRGQIQPGDTVVVVGCGGLGMNAIQGARMSGATRVIAVDPVEFKREQAATFGATESFASMADATPRILELTWGRGAETTILTPSVLTGDMVGEAMGMTSKGGTVVVTAIANMMETDVTMSLFDLAMMNKEVRGTIFGSGNPRSDIPALLKMYRDGALKLDELVTRTYTLDEINQGYEDLREGRNIRGVITFE